jgi:hypothetical protein
MQLVQYVYLHTVFAETFGVILSETRRLHSVQL